MATRIEDDPGDRDRVIVYDDAGNRASMTAYACMCTCAFADEIELLTDRVGWDR
jgi:hypothetical protein